MASETPTDLGTFITGTKPAPWTHTFLDDDGADLDLTGYTAIGYVRRRHTTESVPLSDVDVAADPTTGEVTVTWPAAAFEDAGTWEGTITATNLTNSVAQNFVYCTKAAVTAP